MNEYLPYVIFGIATGSVYGLSAMGLVLTYKTSGLLNFGHGAVCAAAAYTFYELREQHGLPWPLAAFVSIVVFGFITGLIFERVGLLLAGVHISYKIVGTVGILVGMRALISLVFGVDAKPFQPVLSGGTAFEINSVSISWDQVLQLGLGVGAAVGLYLFFKYTLLGTAMRGVVDDPQLLDMTGVSPARVRRSAWIIGSAFAATSGVLFAAAQQQLDVNVLSLLVVQAFGAAAIAQFRNLPMCFVGGIIVGLLQKLISKEVGTVDFLQGLDTNTPFIVLFLVLLLMPRGRLVEVGRHVKARAVPPSPFSPQTRAFGFGVLAIAALLVPHVVGVRLPIWNTAMTQVILFASLALLVRTSGQISLCHIGFAAIGAASFGHMLGHGVPWSVAVLLGGLFAVPAGALIAIPAIRLSGLYLGLATFGFGVLLAQYAYNKEWMFGFGQIQTARPSGFDSDTRMYYLLLAIAVGAVAIVLLVERSRLGRLLRGLADSPVALSTLGTNVNVSRVLVFCLSTFLAGISGAAFASLFGSVNQDSFNYVQSLVVLAVMAISGRRTVTIAVVAPILLIVVPGYISDADAALWLQVGFGFAAVVAAAVSQGSFHKFITRQGVASAGRVVDPVLVADRPEPVCTPAKREDPVGVA